MTTFLIKKFDDDDDDEAQCKNSEFLNELDDSHNIKFTYEVEQGGQLPFLDLLLNRTENGGLKETYSHWSVSELTECGENVVGKKSVPHYRDWR